MKRSAIDQLICLDCRSGLTLGPSCTMDPAHPDEILDGILLCRSCPRRYPVTGGIPRMVDPTSSSVTHIHTGKSFAAGWKAFPRMNAQYRRQFFDWLAPIGPEFLEGKVVLECGCGKGRHAKIASESGVAAIFSVDIGDSVDVAYANVGHFRGVHIIQADIANMPFPADFDFAFSVGVLHHMDRPIDGFRAMCGMIKPHGSVLAWVYGKENNGWLIWVVNPVRTMITSRLPTSILMPIAALFAAPLMGVCKYLAAPWVALRRSHPRLPEIFYENYLAYISRFDFNEIHHIVFDHLVAPVANYISRDYFESFFAEAGLPDPVIRWHNQNSWTGFSSRDPRILETMRSRIKGGGAPDTTQDRRDPGTGPRGPCGS